MRIVLFGSGSPLSLHVLRALNGCHEVVATVIPAGASARFNVLARAAGRVHRFDDSIEQRLQGIGTDLMCVATFPHKLSAATRAVARLGALNIHTSLLPRHRGPDPLFWTYFDNDERSGITIHWMTDRIDAGDILAQRAVPLPRGRPVTDLYSELSEVAATLLLEVVDALEKDNAPARPQDEAEATLDPRPLPGSFTIDFETWGAERVWHFLRGIGQRRGDLLAIAHGPAVAYSLARHDRAPGTIERTGALLRVYCRDGVVEVGRPPMRQRLRAVLHAGRAKLRKLY